MMIANETRGLDGLEEWWWSRGGGGSTAVYGSLGGVGCPRGLVVV